MMGNFAGLPGSGAWLQQAVLQDVGGEADGAAPGLGAQEPPPWMPTLSALLSPFSSSGLHCSSSTSVFPFVVGFSLLSVFLAMLSGFYSLLSLSSLLPWQLP